MKKGYSIVPIVLGIAVLFSACGKTGTDTPSDTSALPGQDISSSEENNTNTEEPGNNSKTEEPLNTQEPEESKEPEEKTETINATIGAGAGYADDNHQVNVIGLKSYKKLKSKLYKDKAAKNKEFLVLFLEINNKQNNKDYINVNYLSAKVDGKKIKNSVLFNDPEGFPTIFKNIEAGETLRGFIVWEVPEDWKKLEVIYDGWKDSNNLSLNCTFTPGDYFDPPQYS